MDKTDKLIKQFGKVTTPSVVPIADDVIIPNHSGITGNKDAMNKLTLQTVTDNGATTTNDISLLSGKRILFYSTNSTDYISLKNDSAGGNALITGDGLLTVRLNDATMVIGSSTHETTGILTLTSTSKGFLPPRMTEAQKNAIGSPAEGLIVYDTTQKKPYYYDGATWISLA